MLDGRSLGRERGEQKREQNGGPQCAAQRDELRLLQTGGGGVPGLALDESRALDLIGRATAQLDPIGEYEIRRHRLLAGRGVVASALVHTQQGLYQVGRLVERSGRGGQSGQ